HGQCGDGNCEEAGHDILLSCCQLRTTLWSRLPGLGRPLRRALPCVTVLSVSTDQSLYQIDNQKQNDRAECRGDNRADYASSQSQPQSQSGEQQSGDKRAGNAEQHVDKEAETRSLYQHSGEPTSYGADDERHYHCHDVHEDPPDIELLTNTAFPLVAQHLR